MALKIKFDKNGEMTPKSIRRICKEYNRAVKKNKWVILNKIEGSVDEDGDNHDIFVIKCRNCFCFVYQHEIEERKKYVKIVPDWLEYHYNTTFTVSYEIALEMAETVFNNYEEQLKIKCPDYKSMNDNELIECLHEYEETIHNYMIWDEVLCRGLTTTFKYAEMEQPIFCLRFHEENRAQRKKELENVLE